MRDHELHPVSRSIAAYGSGMDVLRYAAAQTTIRTRILEAFLAVLGGHDLIVTPTMPVTAFRHPGPEAGNTHVNGKLVSDPMIDFHRLTESPTHAALPAITVNCSFTAEGLPVGLEIIGPQPNSRSSGATRG